jgi:hypothetical protein
MPDIAAGITSGASDVVAVKWSVGKPNAILTPLLTPLAKLCRAHSNIVAKRQPGVSQMRPG